MKILLIGAGFLLLALGAVGVFIPVLPTTPFVLVAAACFGSASPRLYRWLAGTRFFGHFIENYRNKTGVPIRTKAAALIFLWALLVLSMVMSRTLWVTALLLVVGAAVTAHILLIRTKK
jgi:uncharacterized membrane protein YbaN (DUF454 family)